MAGFPSTHWSLILAARDQAVAGSREALETLCEKYWPPIYAFIRQQGYSPEQARDLTQACFAQFLERDFLKTLKPEAGRFRSFLLSSVKNLLADEGRKEHALKRGAGRIPISFDLDRAERDLQIEPSEKNTPESLFEMRWALTVLARALDQVRQEFSQKGKSEHFDHLKVFLTGEKPVPSYRDVGADLHMTDDAVKQAVHRLRKRLGMVVRSEIAETVAVPSEVDAEVRHLLSVLRSQSLQ